MKASKIFLLLAGICLFHVSFGNTVYLEYDQSCMDRYEYRYKGIDFGASHIVYHLRQNNNEKVVLEVGIESKIDYEVKPNNVKTCRDVSLNERMVRDVNNGDIQLFIVKRSGKGYNVSPVGIATYAQITPEGFAFVTLDNMYSYRYNQPANGTDLAKKDSEAKVFFNGTLSHNCPRKYMFTKTKSKAGRNYTEYTIIPEIGILEEKTGFNQTDAANNALELVAINGLPIESYLKDYCQGKDLNYVYSGAFYSNRSGIASSKPYTGSTMADLERGKNSQPVYTNENGSSTSTTTTSTVPNTTTSFNCPVYKDLDRGLYIDRNTGQPATLSCGGNDYRNGKMVNTPITNGNTLDNTTSSNTVSVSPGPSTDGKSFCLEQSSNGIHVVQPSETLYGIAQMYNLSIDDIREFNMLKDDRIFPCMKIKTKFKATANVNDELVAKDSPEYLIHIVAPGETIYQIAKKYGYTVEKFKEINGLESNIISVGQKLRVSNCNCPTPTDKSETFTIVENDIPDSFENTGEKRLIVDNNQKRQIHVVKENETIYVIAKQHNISVAKLRELNNLEVNEVIIPYQRLYIN